MRSARLILKTLGLKEALSKWFPARPAEGRRLTSSGLPTRWRIWCGIPLDLKVAVMGCVVNGPGEAAEADLGIAGGLHEGLLIKHGEIIKKFLRISCSGR